MQRGLEEVVNVFVEKVALQNEGRKRDNLLAGWVLGREKQNNQKNKSKSPKPGPRQRRCAAPPHP